MKKIISSTSESLRISLDKTYVELRSTQLMTVVDLACKQSRVSKVFPHSKGTVLLSQQIIAFHIYNLQLIGFAVGKSFADVQTFYLLFRFVE